MIRKKLSQLKTWRARLDFAIKNELSQEESDYLHMQASDWKCCAVGENRAALERAGMRFLQSGWPYFETQLEETAYDLGIKFSCLISARQYARAKQVLSKIKQLSTQ